MISVFSPRYETAGLIVLRTRFSAIPLKFIIMRHSKLFATPSSALGKIQRLYKLLVKEKKLFEEMATRINDRALRDTVLALAQQNNQYATELSSYIKSTEGREYPAVVIERPPEASSASLRQEIYPDEPGILAFCRNNERKIVLAYRRILKESMVYEGLQKMINYQLSGILAAFMQLKLLSSLKKA